MAKVTYASENRIARIHIHAGAPAFDMQTRRELNHALRQYKADDNGKTLGEGTHDTGHSFTHDNLKTEQIKSMGHVSRQSTLHINHDF